MNLVKLLAKNYSKRELKRVQPLADAVLMLENRMEVLTDDELR